VDVSKLSPEEREPFVRKLMGFTQFEPRLREMAEHPALLRIVRMLVGSDVTMIQDMALLKPPHVGRGETVASGHGILRDGAAGADPWDVDGAG
jgi:hypothetical protein